MKTISSAVSEYIKSKPFLSSALSDGIINLTSLSRIIKPDIEEILRKNIIFISANYQIKKLKKI